MQFRKNLYCLTCLLVCLLAGRVFAQQTSARDMAKEQLIRQRLESLAPSALEPFKSATEALDRGEFTEAARLYEKVTKAAPEFDVALRRLGYSYVMTGRGSEGQALLERAVGIERTPENLASLAEALAYPGEQRKASDAEKRRALAFASEASEKAAASNEDDPSYTALVAQLSLELDREDSFRRATKKLIDRHPDFMASHYFEAIRAATDEDWITAEREIKRAEALGLPSELAEKFLASGVHTRAAVWQYTFYALYLTGVWLCGLFLLFLTGKILSNATLRVIEAADPNDLTNSSHAKLRRIYKAVINFAGFYYYISLPVVIFLVVLVAGSVIYACFSLGRIPIKLVALLVIGSVVTVFQMLRSLFTKREDEEPGRALLEGEAPGLWALVREVAESVGTRAVDEIRVTPGTDLAVYERGSLGERRQDRARRVLILGIGVLNDFTQNSFRAVLAHEYGHFTHRDTAGGDVAIRVNADMLAYAHAMVASGQAVWWNIGFQFLRVYHFIFRRISHGATRLQEMLADRVAVYNYGAKAFKEGLSHVIYRSVEFNHLATKEIQAAMNANRAVQNLYEVAAEPEGSEEEKSIEAAFNKAIHRQTTEDDTHPSPVNRFRLASRILSRNEPPASGTVWELFTDRTALTAEMSGLVDMQLRSSNA